MSTSFFYLLRIKILVSFKSPVNSTTLDLPRNQPLYQLHSGPSCIISGLARVPKLMSLLLLLPNPCPQTSVLPPAIRVTPLKGKSDSIPSLFKGLSLTRSGSPSPYKGLQALHNLTCDSHLSLTSFPRLFAHSQAGLSAFLQHAHTLLPRRFCKGLSLCGTLFPQKVRG